MAVGSIGQVEQRGDVSPGRSDRVDFAGHLLGSKMVKVISGNGVLVLWFEVRLTSMGCQSLKS